MTILLYVDNIIIMGINTYNIQRIKSKLKDTFEMTNMEDTQHYLAIDIEQIENGIWIHQKLY